MYVLQSRDSFLEVVPAVPSDFCAKALLWTMGEGLMGPAQIMHALRICQDELQSHAVAGQESE